MTETVIVCCATPCGLIAEVGETKVKFNGRNDSNFFNSPYGVTEDVPKEFFDAWLKENADTKMVKNNFVFAREKYKDAKSQAKEQSELKTGTEQISQKEL